MKNYLPILFTFFIFSCSGSSYDGEWIIDAGKTVESCESALSESMDESVEDNPFGEMAMGFGSMICGTIASVIPALEISGDTITVDGNECPIKNGAFDCGKGAADLTLDGENLVIELPSSDATPAMSLIFVRKG